MENQYYARIKVFQSDGGVEFTSTCFKTHLRTSDIHHQLSCSYTLAQNGRAERKHCHVTETDLDLLFHSHLSPRFWVDAFSTTVLSTGCLLHFLEASHHLNSSMATPLHYDNFHPFGCCVYPCLRDYMPNKLSPCSIPCIFLGIVPLIKGFVVMIPPPLSYTSPAMLNLMKLIFLLSLAPRLNLFPLFIFQISCNHIFTIYIHSPYHFFIAHSSI